MPAGTRVIESMTGTILHRGPDDSGAWTSDDGSVVLGHRRLSIVDLSPEGHQPMRSASGRFVMVFNGEIYNFRKLRGELESRGARFRGHSDTEVMLAAFDAWGIVESLRRFNGMFAFAVWDNQRQELTVARDRLGEKPLYYGWVGDTLIFGSELKALRRFPGFEPKIDRSVLPLYFAYGYIPTPFTIFTEVSKLPPATYLTVSRGERGRPIAYWSLAGVVEERRFVDSEADAREQTHALLQDAVRIRLEADVPLGALLSGGIDSSLIVALMQSASSIPVRTFTIGFPDARYDEAPAAKAVAAHLGTYHTELRVDPVDALDLIPRLPTIYDEPFADASQIPTSLVFQLARRHVTVVMSGDGGDELFAGYNRHTWAPRVWRVAQSLPTLVRRGARHALQSLSPQAWDTWFESFDGVLPSWMKHRLVGEKLYKLAAILTSADAASVYKSLATNAGNVDSLLVRCDKRPDSDWLPRVPRSIAGRLDERMLYLDTLTYLPDDILAKVDRASMASSVESRTPFLDHRLAELAWSIPFASKVRGHVGKVILRDILRDYVPPALTERPKAGFGVPLDSWLRGPLRDWVEALIEPGKLRSEGYLDERFVHSVWQEHLSGRRNNQYTLWSILMFEAWLASN